MNGRGRTISFVLFSIVIVTGVISALAFAASKTFTGTVGDAMCGAEHVMPGDVADCTRACKSKGSKYALLAGDKVYILDTTDKTSLAELDKWAGKKVTVTGREADNTIRVTSVRAD
jgi:hypothetical protein